jgi:dTMP kinase
MDRGLFITFEGPEGGGKTTMMRRLAQALLVTGRETFCTREPGGTEIGDEIRMLLLNPRHTEMGAITEALLFQAARHEHVVGVIRPNLAEGKIVLCDRYADSSRVYQGYGRGIIPEAMDWIESMAIGTTLPDLSILLDLPVEVGLSRKAGDEWNRMEADEIAFHRRVRAGFLEMARVDPERWRVVDANQSEKEVWQEVWRVSLGLVYGRGLEGQLSLSRERGF